jgi:hypothetical protein
MEDPDENAKAAKTLAARGADENTPAEHFISRDGGGPAAMEAFAIPGGALPDYQVDDKQGTLSRPCCLSSDTGRRRDSSR